MILQLKINLKNNTDYISWGWAAPMHVSCLGGSIPQSSWEGETISIPILQMGKLSLREDILAPENIAKNRQSQDLNPDLPTCILPALSVALIRTLSAPFPQIYSCTAYTRSFLVNWT